MELERKVKMNVMRELKRTHTGFLLTLPPQFANRSF